MAFFRRKIVLPQAPADTRVYAIGDIHGRCDLLDDLLKQIEADSQNQPVARNVLVTLGDYVDRGTDSRGVIDTVLALSNDGKLPGFEVVALLGNHEDLMLAFIEDGSGASMWFAQGGDATLASYGVTLLPDGDLNGDLDLGTVRDQFRDALPPDHLAFLRTLASSHVEGDYMFVHAGIRPGVALPRQDPEDLIWIRDAFLKSRKDHGKVIVHGHSVRFEPEVFPERPKPSRIGIDTGAYLTGNLTCLVLSGDQRRWLQTGPSERFA